MIDDRFYKLSPPQTLGDIATRIGINLPVEGLNDEVITAPASLAESRPGEITFFSLQSFCNYFLNFSLLFLHPYATLKFGLTSID